MITTAASASASAMANVIAIVVVDDSIPEPARTSLSFEDSCGTLIHNDLDSLLDKFLCETRGCCKAFNYVVTWVSLAENEIGKAESSLLYH